MNTNDLNPLESQMRSWTPRRPSPALEERLFGERNEPAIAARAARRQRVTGWGWLAPVACAFVLALQLATPDLNDRTPRGINAAALAGGGSSNVLLASALGSKVLRTDFKFDGCGNRTVVTDSHTWANNSMNNVNGETFKSTNWTPAPSSMRTLPVFLTLTNGLIK